MLQNLLSFYHKSSNTFHNDTESLQMEYACVRPKNLPATQQWPEQHGIPHKVGKRSP
jgi:hypothetical protein